MPAAKRKKPNPELDMAEDFDAAIREADNDSDSDQPHSPVPSTSHPQKRAKASSSRVQTNGGGPKGKAREDTIMVDDDDAEPPKIQPLQRPTAQARELERLRKLVRQRDEQLEVAQDAIRKLTKQLDQLHNLRHSEPEKSRDALQASYTAQVQKLEKVVAEQKTQLARVDKLSRNGRGQWILHPTFITREAAQDERRAVERELEEAREAIKLHQEQMQLKDREIAELNQSLKFAGDELKLQRMNASTSREPPGKAGKDKSRGNALDQHNPAVISFYENITDLLVVNLKPGEVPGAQCFQCVYSPKSREIPDFDFKLTIQPGTPATSPSLTQPASNDLDTRKVIYSPGQTPQFDPARTQHLDYYLRDFQFPINQLPGFLRDLVQKLGEEEDDEDEEDA